MTNEEAIEQIMDYFDFHKVQKVMEFLDWTWADSNNSPSIPELRRSARASLKTAASGGEGCFSGSGGFHAECAGEGLLRLSFYVTDWDTYS